MRASQAISALVATAATAAIAVAPAQAFSLYFGEDINPNPDDRSSTFDEIPNSRAAEADFLAALANSSTEDFEDFDLFQPSPLDLDFGSLGMATLSGGGPASAIKSVDEDLLSDPGVADAVKTDVSREIAKGRNAASGDQYWLTNAQQNFQIDFSAPVEGFGFYAYDLGDYEAQTFLDIYREGSLLYSVEIPNTTVGNGGTNGSAFYLGLLTEDESEVFDQVIFRMNDIQGDEFAFDDFTVGERVPEPTVLLGLVGISALAVVGLRRDRG